MTEHKLWAGWKVALLWLGIAVVGLFVIGVVVAASGEKDPHAAGERIGRTWGVAVFLAPIVAYIIQKMRLDHANRPGARKPPTA